MIEAVLSIENMPKSWFNIAMSDVDDKPEQLSLGSEFEAEAGAISLSRTEVVVPESVPDGKPYTIKAVYLENFKGFKKFEINLGRFNVLVGSNNSGKSTVLRAIRLAYELTKLHFHRERNSQAEFYPGRSVPKSLLPVAQLKDLWPSGKLRAGNTWIPSKVTIQLDTGHKLAYGIIGPWNAATSKIEAADLFGMNSIPAAVINKFLNSPPEFVPASIGIVAEEEYRTPARRSTLVTSGRHNEIVRNYLLEFTEDQQAELRTLLDRYFKAHVDTFKFDGQKDQFISTIYMCEDGEHDIFSAGGGFLQIVEVLAFIFRGNPGVVLLDEPDSHLNSSLQHAFIDILESLASSRGFQVLMATHSKEIINYVDPSRLIPVDRKNNKAEALKQETGTVTVLKELGAIDNVDAYQIVKQKSLLIVEGQTDRELIPRLAAKSKMTLFDGPTRISILPANGVDRLSDGSGLTFVETLLGSKIRALLLRDRDGLTDVWAAAVKDDSNRPMFIWPRDSLESYLIIPNVFQRILGEELGDAAPSLKEIEDVVSEVIKQMYNETVDRVATGIQKVEWKFNKKRVEAAEANPQARAEAERLWETNPLALIHGKTLLSRIRGRIQEKWKASFGNARIVETMMPEEVHQDIRDLLSESVKTLVS